MAQPTLTLSTGLLAGLHIATPLVTVPAILASSDPLPVWQSSYCNGRYLALTTIGVSAAAGVKGFLDSGHSRDYRFLLASGLTSALVVYTLICMKPINDALFAIQLETRKEEEEKVRELVRKWGKFQLARTALALGAFATTIYISCKR